MKIKEDRDVRRVFGLSDLQLGEITGKTRQAINHGLEKELYFKEQEWTLIYLHVQSFEDQSKIDELVKYVSKKFPNWKIPRTENSELMPSVVLNDFSKIVCIIADYRHFREVNPNCTTRIFDAWFDNSVVLEFYTGVDVEKNILNSQIKSELKSRNIDLDPGDFRSDFLPGANIFPYMICCDPETPNRSYFTCSSDKFIHLDSHRGDAIFSFISQYIDEHINEKKEAS